MSLPENLPTPAPGLPPPSGYSSWIAYAVATMDTRSLQNDHDCGNQAQWPAVVTREAMQAAAQAALDQIESTWDLTVRACEGRLETIDQLAAWAEKELAKRQTGEVTSNPEAMAAIEEHQAGETGFAKSSDIPDGDQASDEQEPVFWRGRDLSGPGAIMYYHGRMDIDSIHGSAYLVDLPETPCLDSVLWSGSYDVEIRAIRRLTE